MNHCSVGAIRLPGTAAVLAALMFVLAACGGQGSGSEQTTTGSGELDGGGKEIVFFSGPRSSPYNIDLSKTIDSRAKELGYTVRTIEAPVPDQTTQDGLIRQFLSTGAEPAAFIWVPMDTNASEVSARALSAVAPLFQTNADVVKATRQYVKVYGGVDDVQVGRNAGEVLIAQREKDREAGVDLKSGAGNVLDLALPSGFQGTVLRQQGFTEATKDEPFNIVHTEYGPYYSVQTAYENAAQIIPKYKDDIDYILVSGNTGAAEGTIRALRQNGLEPGRDVKIVAGTCNAGGVELLNDGEIIGTSLQSPYAEGRIVTDAVAQYLATGEVKSGVTTLDNAPEPPTVKVEAPSESTYMPMPLVTTADEFNSADIWGYDARQVCGESK